MYPDHSSSVLAAQSYSIHLVCQVHPSYRKEILPTLMISGCVPRWKSCPFITVIGAAIITLAFSRLGYGPLLARRLSSKHPDRPAMF